MDEMQEVKPERPSERLYWVVQDKVAGVERLVRQDGAYGEHPEGTLLPWAKGQGLKLKKEVDDDLVREFSFILTAELEEVTKTPDGRETFR